LCLAEQMYSLLFLHLLDFWFLIHIPNLRRGHQLSHCLQSVVARKKKPWWQSSWDSFGD
jgi:hypothetical protein